MAGSFEEPTVGVDAVLYPPTRTAPPLRLVSGRLTFVPAIMFSTLRATSAGPAHFTAPPNRRQAAGATWGGG